MDEGIGQQFAHGRHGEHRDRTPESLFDDLVLGQESVDIGIQPLKPASIAFCFLAFLQRIQPAATAIVNHAHSFSAQGTEVIQSLGKEYRAEIGDVPSSGIRTPDKFVARQGLKDTETGPRLGLIQKVEVGLPVQQTNDILLGRAFERDAVLKWRAVENAPKGALLFRIVLEILLVTADANILPAGKTNRMVDRPGDFCEHNRPSLGLHSEEMKIDLRF